MSSDPVAIRLDLAENRLEIDWSDGHQSRFDAAYLRWTCPCARCRGHAPGEVEPPTWAAVKDVTVSHAEAVGTYALRFTFSDGHDTGIYAFDWLRQQCPRLRDDVDDTGRPLAG